MFVRKQHWHLVSERTLGLMNVLRYHWCETSLLAISSSFEACGVPNISSFCARDQFCILPRMKKPMVLFHIKNFSYHVTLLLEENFSMWVICGSHLDCSVGQMG